MNDNNTSNEGIFQYDHNNKAFEFNNYGGVRERAKKRLVNGEVIKVRENGL